MKKSMIRWWIVLAVLLVVYNVVAFAVPFVRGGVFFVSWFFTLIALGAQVYVIRSAFYKGEGVKSKFYGFPVAKIGAVYLIAQMLLSLLFMAVGVYVPSWIPLVLYVVLLGASAVGFVAVDATRDEVIRQDVKLKKDVAMMRALQSKAASLPSLTQNNELKRALEQFAEEVRYSDPVSSESLQDIESRLSTCVEELQTAVINNRYNDIMDLLQRAETVLAERNRLCKLNK